MATEAQVRERVGSVAADERLARVRAEMPAVEAEVYFNTGTNGPLPRRSVDATIALAEEELAHGRIGPAVHARSKAMKDDARAKFATLLACGPDEIALTHCTTEGMNIALHGLDWRPGDEIVTSVTEHPGGLYPVYVLRDRRGVRVRQTEIGMPGLDPVAALKRALTPRTRAVVLSHVCWSTGMVLPLRELSDLAHEVGALFICDAAQSCGMVPSHVSDLGVDAYACSGQKWLCGPDGTGALFLRRDRFGEVAQTYVNWQAFTHCDTDGYFVPAAGAARYEAATLYPPAVAGLGASLGWLADDVGWDWIYARIAALGGACYDALAQVSGVTMHTPREQMAGLVHFTLGDLPPADVTAWLGERGILIRHVPRPAVNRVSTGFYNTEEEIAQLASALTELATSRG